MLLVPGMETAGASGRSRAESGSVTLEAAVVTTLFLTLVLGLIEGGFALHDKLSTSNMSLAGARTASGEGAEVLADYYVLQAVRRGAGGIPASRISAVVVYRASAPGDRVPTPCKEASVAGTCNRYVGADVSKDPTQFGCVGPPGPTTKIDSSWCPTSRKTALSGANGPPDYIGVFVETVHNSLTGVMASGITLRADTIIRIEPRTLT